MSIPFRRSLKDLKGFTLVELLVVIAIIGVLATLLLLQLGTARAKSRDTKRIGDINQFRTAAEQYFDDNGGVYPNVSPLTTTEVGKYFSSPALPIDPVTSLPYFYARNPAGAGAKPIRFHLWTEMESKSPSAFAGDADINSSTWTGGGDIIDASVATTEVCTANYNAGAARDCIYDVGQK